MTENFIKNIVAAMQDSLTDEQLQKLENVCSYIFNSWIYGSIRPGK